MDRRTGLATLGTAGFALLGGCIGDSTDTRPELAIDRADSSNGCIERELLDFERVQLGPRLASVIGIDTTVKWELSLREGEELYLRITNPDMDFLPHLRVVDSDGTAIIDERPVDTIYRIQSRNQGSHMISLSNRRWGEGGEWFVDLSWYNEAGCS